MARISLRRAKLSDATRLIGDGVLSGALPAGDSWEKRVAGWLHEMEVGRRIIIVAESGGSFISSGQLVGLGQLVLRFGAGYEDPEAANGTNIAMVDAIRTRPDAGPAVANEIMSDFTRIARKRGIKRLTFLVPMDNNRALAQAKGWGFEEFRIMPEGGRLLAFFRKAL